MSEQLERRIIATTLRADGRHSSDGPDLPRISGYSAVFDQTADLGAFRETVKPGTFAETLRTDPVMALFNHDANYPLGGTRDGRLQLREDAQGLWMSVQPTSTAYATDLVTNIRAGVVNQQSFGFECRLDRWTVDHEGRDLRELHAVKLYDVSPVVFPAYTGTSVDVRTAFAGQLETRDANRRAHQVAMDAKGRATCDVCHQAVTAAGSIAIDWRASRVIAARCPRHGARDRWTMARTPRTGVPARAAPRRERARARLAAIESGSRRPRPAVRTQAGRRSVDTVSGGRRAVLAAELDRLTAAADRLIAVAEARAAYRRQVAGRVQSGLAAAAVQRRREALRY